VTRGRVEINISSHGSLFINGLWQRYISSRCVVLPTSFAAPPPGNAEYVWLYAQLRFLAPYANVDKLRLTPLYISKLPNSIKIRRVLHLGPSR